VVNLRNISVRYRLIRERRRSFQAHLINYLKGKRVHTETLAALTGISLHVPQGESLGIIGHNGAGKSTLLKVVSGIIKPVEGYVQVEGRIAPLIELGAGFDPELTGRENIYLNASILGFSRRDIGRKFGQIVDFSELQDFINSPLKNYSSGMISRLGFSVATEVDPDILIIDEVLSVGDEGFRRKSRERILEFRKKGITILFVSHNMDEIRSLCGRVLWLEHGNIRMQGVPDAVISAYSSLYKETDR
jgi:ABC-2 type transport system ATP-binding protein